MSNTIWFRSSGSDNPAGEELSLCPSLRERGTQPTAELIVPAVEQHVHLVHSPEPIISLTQPSSPPSRRRVLQPLVDITYEPPAQRRRLDVPPNLGHQGSGPHRPGARLYPPLPTRVPNRPEPSAANRGEIRYIGDLLPNQARVLGQFLWVGRTEPNGPIRYFEATYEGPNDDQYWGNFNPPIPPQEGITSWGHHRWLLGRPRELTEDQLPAQVGDITHRTLRFLHLP